MTKVIGAKVATGAVHLHSISDIALQNNQNDTVTTGRPVLYIVNGERVEYTREELEAELLRRATVVEHYAAGERMDPAALIARLAEAMQCSHMDACDVLEAMEDGNMVVVGDMAYTVTTGGHHEEAQSTWTLTVAPYYA